jgi:hypothetical protein
VAHGRVIGESHGGLLETDGSSRSAIPDRGYEEMRLADAHGALTSMVCTLVAASATADLTPQQKQAALARHNQMRSDVASGLADGQPTAADMEARLGRRPLARGPGLGLPLHRWPQSEPDPRVRSAARRQHKRRRESRGLPDDGRPTRPRGLRAGPRSRERCRSLHAARVGEHAACGMRARRVSGLGVRLPQLVHAYFLGEYPYESGPTASVVPTTIPPWKPGSA